MAQFKGGTSRIELDMEIRIISLNLSLNLIEMRKINDYCEKYNHVNHFKGAFLRRTLLDLTANEKCTVVEKVPIIEIYELTG